MILTETVIMKWNGRNKKYYKEKGYNYTNQYDTFIVIIKDLPKCSKSLIQAKCDYCMEQGIETIITERYADFNKSRQKIQKDCCKKCRMLKAKEIINKIYNVDNVFEIFEVQKKIHDNRKLENNPNWKGGKNKLIKYIRDTVIPEWRNNSLKKYEYRCTITGIKCHDLEVHHLYPLNVIIKNILEELNLPCYNTYSEYNKNDLDKIIGKIKEYHENNLGVVLLNSIHKLYHQIYGYTNNNKKEFEEFVEKFDNHEFDKILKIA